MLPSPASARPRRRLARLSTFAALALVLACSSTPASSDACSSCPAPGAGDLAGADGFELLTRYDMWGAPHRDMLFTDGGECSHELVAPPAVVVGKTWTVLRGSGTVFNCPWGASDAAITFSLASGDSTDWKADVELSVTLSALVAKMTAAVGASIGGSRTTTEVQTVTQSLEAGPGHVLDWTGYFQLADLTLDADFKVRRRFAWWTKNATTGHVVQRKGDHTMECGVEHVTLSRQASIGFSVHVMGSTCDGQTPPLDLGTFPRPLPPPPVTTPPAGALPPAPTGPMNDDDPAPDTAPSSAPSAPATAPPSTPPSTVPTTAPSESGDLPIAPTGPLSQPLGDPAAEEAR